MSLEKYPLEELAKIKVRKFEQALKLFEEKTARLLEEEEKLFKTEEERNKCLEHKEAKLNQLREALDSGAKHAKIEMMKNYLKVVKEELKEKERKVESQKREVEKAENELEEAKKNLFQKKKDVEKLKIHKTEWKKIEALEDLRKEAIEEDEIGSVRHIFKKKGQKGAKND
ncbi:MAG: type III secretion T3S chaperone [Parachlamydiales bacterium]|jgi:flagellar biosynthesis chaperone FliJ